MQLTLRPHPGPLYRQLFETLRTAILEGSWKPGQRIPPSRELARQLDVSRNTVSSAYDMLQAEGYLSARQGSGYFVVEDLPDSPLPRPALSRNASSSNAHWSLSRRGVALASDTRPTAGSPNPAFQVGLPDLQHFPFRQWQQSLQKCSRQPATTLTTYQNDGGDQGLKEALCDYLQLSRGLNCRPEHIVVASGSQAALDLIARILLNPADSIAVEDPGYLGARNAFRAAGAKLIPVPVDEEGPRTAGLEGVRLLYTTPSYQFPLSVTMSATRRLQVLNWATQQQAMVIEDDYDGEFRYRERPLSSLQGLDRDGRVIYLGTFSKVMFPGLRLGYLVLPESYARSFALALRKTGQDPPLIWQAAMADFIRSGHFASHLRRMRKLYSEKQQHFVTLAQRHLGDWLRVEASSAGMQLPCDYRQAMDEQKLLALGREAGLNLSPLSRYYLPDPDGGESDLQGSDARREGLHLGYAGVPLANMEAYILQLQRCFRAL